MTGSNFVSLQHGLEQLDPIWIGAAQRGGGRSWTREPALAGFVYAYILNHDRLEDGGRASHRRPARHVRHRWRRDRPRLRGDVAKTARILAVALRADLVAVYDRDPACTRFIEPVLYFKGFHAIQTQRLSHWLLRRPAGVISRSICRAASSEVFQVDINPAVPMGKGIFIDHGDGRRRRRDGRHRGRRLDPAERDARRHGQGDRRSPSEDPPRRSDRRRRQDPRQYRDRPLLAGGRGLGRPSGGSRRTRRSPACRPRSSAGPDAIEPSRAMEHRLGDE